jgi:DNA-binding transcriptional regulator GbsR (MarR family)
MFDIYRIFCTERFIGFGHVGPGMSDTGDGEAGTDADGDVDEDVRAAREEVIEAMARTAEVWGAKRSYGRLFGVLFFADEPLSLDALAERSDYAKSTVSTAMNTLERYHLVQRRSIPGEGKKAFFEAETDFWYVIQQFFQNEVSREIRIMSRALDSAADRLDAADSDQAERDLEKVRKLQSVYDKSERAVSLVTSQPVDRLSGLLDRFGDDS